MLIDLTCLRRAFCGRSIFTGKYVFGRSMRFFGVYNNYFGVIEVCFAGRGGDA